jgi:hypothetical protein
LGVVADSETDDVIAEIELLAGVFSKRSIGVEGDNTPSAIAIGVKVGVFIISRRGLVRRPSWDDEFCFRF